MLLHPAAVLKRHSRDSAALPLFLRGLTLLLMDSLTCCDVNELCCCPQSMPLSVSVIWRDSFAAVGKGLALLPCFAWLHFGIMQSTWQFVCRQLSPAVAPIK